MNAASVADPGKVVPLVGGQQQCPGQRGQHLPRRLRAAALLQPDVVVDGHPGQLGDLLAAQPGVRRRPTAGSPASHGDTRARLARRNAASSARFTTVTASKLATCPSRPGGIASPRLGWSLPPLAQPP